MYAQRRGGSSVAGGAEHCPDVRLVRILTRRPQLSAVSSMHYAPVASRSAGRRHREHGANAALQRAINRALVLRQVLEHGQLSRAALAAATGLHKATVSLVVEDLLRERLLEEVGTQRGRAGRPAILLELHRTAHLLIGIQLGRLRTVLCNMAAQIVDHWTDQFEPSSQPDHAMELLLTHVSAARLRAQKAAANVLGIGIALPGMVDVAAGVLVRSDHLGWRHVPIGRLVEQATRLPVVVEKSTSAALLGEHYFGSARGVREAIYVELSGRGIGGAVLVAGELYTGSSHLAGEIGHMVVEPHGPPCACGTQGCLETLASEAAVLRHAQRLLVTMASDGALQRLPTSSEEVCLAARQGDHLCLQALRETGYYLGIGVANLVNIFNPELVIVGGAQVLEEDTVWQAMEEAVAARALREPAQACRVVRPALGNNGYAIGAAALALRAIVGRPGLATI